MSAARVDRAEDLSDNPSVPAQTLQASHADAWTLAAILASMVLLWVTWMLLPRLQQRLGAAATVLCCAAVWLAFVPGAATDHAATVNSDRLRAQVGISVPADAATCLGSLTNRFAPATTCEIRSEGRVWRFTRTRSAIDITADGLPITLI